MPQIIINEFYRGGNLTTGDEFIELLLVEDLTAAQLNAFFVGDSTSAKASKFSAYDFTNMGAIAPVFEAGTIIAVGGTARFAQDTSYNPTSGDWNILLNAGGSFLPNANSGNTGDIAGDDIVWVDTANTGATISANGFAVDIGTAVGAFTAAAIVNFGASVNNTGYALNSDLAGAANTANWTTNIPSASTTPGQANGGANTTYINSLRSGTPPETVTVSIAASDAAAAEAGSDPGIFRISRTGSTAAALTVSYTVAGSATNGTDYTPNLTGTATIPVGAAFVDVTITPVDDTLVEGDETVILTLVDTADYDLGSATTATVTIADNDVAPQITRIFTIQGAAHTSPLVGQSVITEGIVTAVDSNGFYLQDPIGDNNISTSDAIFVFTRSAPTVTVGSEVRVAGTVSEFFPGGQATGNLSTTQISGNLTITTLSTGNALPAAVILGAGGRVPPSENIDDDAFGSFDPVTDGIDFFESLEAMRVTAQNAVAVSGTNAFGEIFAVVDGGASATGLSDRGTLNISPNDFNPERVQIDEDTDILPGFVLPQVATGAQLGDVTGVISYEFGNFQIQPTQAFTAVASPLQPEVSSLEGTENQLTVASYNVLNLDPNDQDGNTDVADGRFTAIANQIVNNLNAPDIIGLQEIQDNSGSVNNGVTAADVTLQTLVDAIAAAGGPQYQFIDNPFVVDGQVGGEPGGNIRTAFLYNPDRVELVAGTVRTVNDQAAFSGSRLPLAADFTFNGEAVTVVTNHFSSKGGSAPIFGVQQPFEARQEDPTVNGSLDQRQAQAQAVKDFVDPILAGDSDAKVVVLGDFNEFEFISPIEDILGSSLNNLTNTLPENERYSFIFQGNSQSLDHILVSDSLLASAEFDAVHVNAEFAETDQRASDHDPLLARLTISAAINVINGTPGRDTLIGTADRDRITGGFGGDTITGGAGADEFVYTSTRDAGDRITDFTVGQDRIVLTQLLDSLVSGGYSGNAIADGYIRVVAQGSNAIVQLDQDGIGTSASFRSFITLENVAASTVTASSFVF
jgi:hypothetical protein